FSRNRQEWFARRLELHVRWPHFRKRRFPENQIRRLLGDHYRRSIGVRGCDPWHHGCVANPNTLKSAKLQRWIDHRRLIAAHPARSHGMMVGLTGPKRVADEFFFARRCRARHALNHDEGFERGLTKYLASDPQSLERGRPITPIGPIVRVYQGHRE